VISNLNLASKPFTNHLLPWVMTAAVLFVSLIGLLVVVNYTLQANRESAATRIRINNLRTQEKGLLDDAKKVRESMTHEQLQALDAAAVRSVGMQGDQTVADLELTVFSKSANVITSMIADMDRAGVFQADLRAQNLQKGRGESGSEYDLDVIYRPRSGYSSENVAAVKETGTAKEESK